ncbi:MAG: histidine kinase, partial [Bacteroidales bacterium]|nr:histidine kinase [Bacteroidales bacterium]
MRNKLAIQIIFWITILGILFGFGLHLYPTKIAIISALINAFFFAIAIYMNALMFLPKYYNTKKVHLLLIFNFLVIGTISIILRSIEVHSLSEYVNLELRDNKPPEAFKYIKNISWMFLLVSFSSTYILQQKLIKNEEQSKLIIEDKLNAELKLLKAQINPHFLFNALNNIYSLTYKKSDKAPESVLELSKMLRYVIEDGENEFVFLKSEIDYIKSYISFQRMKLPNEINVNFEYNNLDINNKISPLLFIPFIENSFKYSRIEEDENAFIDIKFNSSSNNRVVFTIENSITKEAKA